jgi:hypothetical protein
MKRPAPKAMSGRGRLPPTPSPAALGGAGGPGGASASAQPVSPVVPGPGGGGAPGGFRKGGKVKGKDVRRGKK